MSKTGLTWGTHGRQVVSRTIVNSLIVQNIVIMIKLCDYVFRHMMLALFDNGQIIRVTSRLWPLNYPKMINLALTGIFVTFSILLYICGRRKVLKKTFYQIFVRPY